MCIARKLMYETCVYVCVQVCMYVYAHMSVCIYVCVCMCMYTYVAHANPSDYYETYSSVYYSL